MPPEFTDRKVNLWPATGALGLAHVDHHSLRSRESFLLKCLRGDAVTESRLGLETEEQAENAIAYWEARAGTAGAPHRPNVPPDAEERRAAYLADPDLRALHDAAHEAHRRRLGTILTTAAGARVADRIGYHAT
jgi:hypothetical protein